MREPFVFDPRHPLCKTPFGAAVCGSQIALRCRPLAAEGFTHCALILQQEFSGLRQELKASFSGIEGDRACFALDFSAPAEPELVWYAFRLWRDDGSGCMLDKTGYRSDGGWDPWQLTVYQKSFSPAWFGQGITYQIFPDRFAGWRFPLRRDLWVSAGSIRTGQRLPPGGRKRTERCGTGTFSAAPYRELSPSSPI